MGKRREMARVINAKAKVRVVEVTVRSYGKNEVVEAGVVSELTIEWRR